MGEELHSDDPAMALLNEYIDKEVRKRVTAEVSSVVSEMEEVLTEFKKKIVELEDKLEKIDKQANKKMHGDNDVNNDPDDDSEIEYAAQSPEMIFDSDDSTGPDLDEIETEKWGKTFGESSTLNKKPCEQKSEDEIGKKSRGPGSSRGRPKGRKNRGVLKEDLRKENEALKRKLKQLNNQRK